MRKASDMKTEYKYTRFKINKESSKRWMCLNKQSNTTIGWCEYYNAWYQWVFEGYKYCIFSASCLDDIAHFLRQLNEQGKRASNECGSQVGTDPA